MVLDTRIPLMVQVPDIGPAAQMFSNALTNIANRDQIEQARALEQERAIAQNQLLNLQIQEAQQNIGFGQAQQAQAAQQQKLMQAAQINQLVGPMLQGDGANPPNLTGAYRVLKQSQGALDLTDEDIEEFQQAVSTPEGLQAIRGSLSGAANIVAQSRSGTATTADATNRRIAQSIKDPQERRRFELAAGLDPIGLAEQEAQVDIQRAGDIERTKRFEARRSEFLKEQGDRSRSATRSQNVVRRASKLVEMADQGITGQLKVGLSRLVPLDVQNEADLDQAFKQIALENLRQFKGPTTDFEFNVVQDIAGRLGGGKSGNRAKINALARNNWFIQKEAEQAREWIDAGNSPDDFVFDFGEKVQVGNNTYTLEDLQDTAVQNNLTIEQVIEKLERL